MTPLSQAHAEVKAEIARCDSKASLLIAFNGVALNGVALASVWTAASTVDLPAPAAVLAAMTGLLLGAGIALLLLAVRPNLRGGHGFPRWAQLAPDQIRTEVVVDVAADIAGLSRLAVAKMRRLQLAVDLTLSALALLLTAALITAGSAL